MSDEVRTAKVPIRGWLILVAIALWATPITFLLLLVNALLLPVPRLPWFEMTLIVVTGILGIIALMLFLMRRRIFVHAFVVLQIWAMVSSIISFSAHFTSLGSFLYSLIGNLALLLYVLRSKRVKMTFTR